jgi:hypothetical protein
LFDINKFYEILALLYYNPERTRLLENILKAFFENPSQYFNINDAFEIEQKKELTDKKTALLQKTQLLKSYSFNMIIYKPHVRTMIKCLNM